MTSDVFCAGRPFAATFQELVGFEDMTTFLMKTLKVLLVIALAILVLKFWPLLAVPALLATMLILVLGGVAGLAATLILGLALAALGSAAAVVLAIVGATLPLALPVLVVIGIVALVRSRTRNHA